GSVSANKVEVYGKNIRILDAGTVSAATRPVILHTDAANDGYAHIGYQTATPPAASAYTVNGTAATAADNYYKLVHNTTEFQNISSNLAGNYMLANDIDFTDPVTLAPKAVTPLGGNGAAPFTGKIDGNFYKVKNYTVSTATGRTEHGLFGRASGAHFDNIGIKGVNIALPTGQTIYGGALVGYTTGNTVLRGVSVTDSTVTGRPGYAGGIIGGADHTTVSESYSKVTTNSGGILGGAFGNGTVFNDVYGDVTATPSANVAGLAYFIQNPSVFAPGFIVNRAYSTAAPFVSSSTAPPINDTYTINKNTGEATLYGLTTPPPAANAKTSATYTNWNINNDGAPGAKWRIYEGRTLPMLTAFMDGTATATYNYRYFKADGTPSAAAGNTVKTNGTLVGGNIVPHSGADISPEYNSYYLKIVDKNTPNAVGGVSNV
ncbi:MAG: filamentous hemagglutinin, partial [Selenomonas sp.]|nr:filamentous hemagglutinin [Selenomonas sp.]